MSLCHGAVLCLAAPIRCQQSPPAVTANRCLYIALRGRGTQTENCSCPGMCWKPTPQSIVLLQTTVVPRHPPGMALSVRWDSAVRECSLLHCPTWEPRVASTEEDLSSKVYFILTNFNSDLRLVAACSYCSAHRISGDGTDSQQTSVRSGSLHF